MDRHDNTPAAHTGGWTHQRRVQFLRCLAAKGDVRAACAEIGLSRQSVYKLRDRDRAFARVWDAAVEVARDERSRRTVARLLARRHREVWLSRNGR